MAYFKPCPFCGCTYSPEFISENAYAELNDGQGSNNGWYVICNANRDGCGSISGWAGTKLEALGKWNNAKQFETKMIEVDETTIMKILTRLDKLEKRHLPKDVK